MQTGHLTIYNARFSKPRASLCATNIEKFAVARQHCEQALTLLHRTSASDSAKKNDIALFKKQLDIIQAHVSKEQQRDRARADRKAATQLTQQGVEQMYSTLNVTKGAPLFGQQRRYAKIQPTKEDDEWLWPILLVYPEEITSPGMGDQSDYLEDVSANATIHDILVSVFSQGRAEWDITGAYTDIDSLEARFRVGWTVPVDELEDEDRDTWCGSLLPPDEVGKWISLPREMTVAELVSHPRYVIPLFPLLYVVPRHVKLR